MRYYRATIADCEALVALRLALRRERDSSFDGVELGANTLFFFQRNLADGSHVAFVCEDGGTLIGSVGLSLFEMPPTDKLKNGKVIKLMNMYTVPERRKEGIAHTLLAMALDFAKEHDYHKIMLNASPMGQALYEKAGFTLIPNEYQLTLD